MSKRYEIHTQMRNSADCWENIDIEHGSRNDFELGEVSSEDTGIEIGTPLRLLLIDPDDISISDPIDTREITVY